MTLAHTSREIRAQFFNRSTPAQVIIPKTAMPQPTTIDAKVMDLTKGGAAVALGSWSVLRPMIAKPQHRIVNAAKQIPTIAATVTVAEGLGFMGWYISLSPAAGERGFTTDLRMWNRVRLQTDVSHFLGGKEKSTRR